MRPIAMLPVSRDENLLVSAQNLPLKLVVSNPPEAVNQPYDVKALQSDFFEAVTNSKSLYEAFGYAKSYIKCKRFHDDFEQQDISYALTAIRVGHLLAGGDRYDKDLTRLSSEFLRFCNTESRKQQNQARTSSIGNPYVKKQQHLRALESHIYINMELERI